MSWVYVSRRVDEVFFCTKVFFQNIIFILSKKSLKIKTPRQSQSAALTPSHPYDEKPGKKSKSLFFIHKLG
jgi:hypothetical protein